MTALQDIRIFPYLTPDPLKENSFLEESWISWFPSYKIGDTADGLPSFFHEDNIAYYEKIENFVSEQFHSALQRMWPAIDGIYIDQIQISIDFLVSTGQETLASYLIQKSNPAKGKYVFSINQNLLLRYLHTLEGKEGLIPKKTIWEHELVHLLDHWQLVNAQAFSNSDNPSNAFTYYLLKYREEGIANLYELMDGKLSGNTSRAEATKKFILNVQQAKKILEEYPNIHHKEKLKLYSGYEFYELGPWLILDKMEEMIAHTELEPIQTLEEKIAAGVPISDESKLAYLKYALMIDNEWFLSKFRIDPFIYSSCWE
jgi:hypothetical protein